jgi:predicted transposase/invertase (TIGR01784 family)
LDNNKEKIRLDEVIKSLFAVSKPTLLKMMNSLFDENFDIDSTEISFENNEFILEELDVIRGDLFLKVVETEKPYHYHIEFQTLNDKSMVLRMFEYGFNKAKELSKCKLDNNPDELVLHIPKQLVIFIEENNKIKDELKMRLIFPDNQEILYKVNVMKYWKYTDEDLIEKKLYTLLPLQIFKLRYSFEKIKDQKDFDIKKDSKLQELMSHLVEVVNKISLKSKQLFDYKQIDGEDTHKMLLAIDNLFKYMNRRYGNSESLEMEVEKMTRSLYDPVVAQRAREEGIEEGIEKGREEGIEKGKIETAIEMLKLGVDIEFASKATKISIDVIRSEYEKYLKKEEKTTNR